jgi:hypothetical protein
MLPSKMLPSKMLPSKMRDPDLGGAEGPPALEARPPVSALKAGMDVSPLRCAPVFVAVVECIWVICGGGRGNILSCVGIYRSAEEEEVVVAQRGDQFFGCKLRYFQRREVLLEENGSSHLREVGHSRVQTRHRLRSALCPNWHE